MKHLFFPCAWVALGFIVLAGNTGCTRKLAQLKPVPASSAEDLFQKYSRLEQESDPRKATLYLDQVKIKHKQKNLLGNIKSIIIPGLVYKQMIAQSMPLAKVRREYSDYTKIIYKKEGEQVRITAAYFNHLTKRSGILTLLVGKDRNAQWRILEELTEEQE